MSYFRIQHKGTESCKRKMRSEQSRNYPAKYSLQRIAHESVIKKRTVNHSLSSKPGAGPQAEIKHDLEQAKKAYKSKDTKKALTLFKKIYEKCPGAAEIPYFIGSCLLNDGNFSSALTYFQHSRAMDPHIDKNVYIFEAICHKSLNQIPEALSMLAEAIERYPRFEQALFYKAKMHLKVNQSQQAIQSLKKCVLINSQNQLAYILLGDTQKAIGRVQQSLQSLKKAASLSSSHDRTAFLKYIDTLIENKQVNEALAVIKQAHKVCHKCPQLSYFEGLCSYLSGDFSEAVILLEISLGDNLNRTCSIKAFKTLMEIAIAEKDFFGAEHLIARSKQCKLKDPELDLYHSLIEVINDLIKRKADASHSTLRRIYKQVKNKKKYAYLMKAMLPFYAYCQFMQKNLGEAVQLYTKYLQIAQKEDSFVQRYNHLICQAITQHKNREFGQAEQSLSQAHQIMNDKVEPFFLLCINEVQQVSSQQVSSQQVVDHAQGFFKVHQIIKQSAHISPPSSLFLFYQALIALYEGHDALPIIQKAIEFADDEISEYYFIEGLAYSLAGKTARGLRSIDKAIEIDHSIREFYKERSKYLYLLERYPEAVESITHSADICEDSESKLLLTFFYYLMEQYSDSLKTLKEINDEGIQIKFEQLEQALYFRLHRYSQCGIVGELLQVIEGHARLPKRAHEELQLMIKLRNSYSQFSIYMTHVLMAIYHIYSKEFDQALDHLFAALEEADQINEGNEYFCPAVEAMFSEVKFNILITNLLKMQEKRSQGSGNIENLLEETVRYAKLFISETEDEEFRNSIESLIIFLESEPENKDPCYDFRLAGDSSKVSDSFEDMNIVISPSKTITTKPHASYPRKLTFNIAPEFDDSFLMNFDVDKIENILCPPWYKLQRDLRGVIFTEHIRSESVLLSETDKPNTPLLVPPPVTQNLRDKFKLQESVERKLNRIIKRK